MTSSDHASVERTIEAPAAEIFALLADATRHRDIDGSGSVKGARGRPEPLSLGSTFGMSMRIGLPYSMVNTVVEFEQDRRIAWQTRAPSIFGKLVGGRIWRYELEPTDGGTLVRETWDLSEESALSKPGARRMETATVRNMAATLERIDRLLTDKG